MNAGLKGARNENRFARPLEAGVDPPGTRTLMDDSNPHGRRQCTARARQTGERCKKARVTGRTVCRSHGGATPVGAALRQYKGAGRSRYLPVAMAERCRAEKAVLTAITAEFARLVTIDGPKA